VAMTNLPAKVNGLYVMDSPVINWASFKTDGRTGSHAQRNVSPFFRMVGIITFTTLVQSIWQNLQSQCWLEMWLSYQLFTY